ncbi:MAG: hypothetical protein KBT21_09455 [Treponema sp.]|nr:hypothetical protein [Candidatus Treponema merdequi]
MLLTICLSSFCYIFLVIDHYLRLSGSVKLAVIFKGMASLCFLSLAVYSFINCRKKSAKFRRVSVFVLTGIIIAGFADIVLELNFVMGFVLFMIAQLFYFYAFSGYGKLKPKFFIYSAILIIILTSVDIASPLFNFEKDGENLLFPSIVYMISLVVVVVQGSESFKMKDIHAKTMAIGTSLFAWSDFLLEMYVFPSGIFSKGVLEAIFIFSNLMYYTGQLMVAWSLSKDYCEEQN